MKTTLKIEYHTAWGESLCLISGGRKYPMRWTEGDIWELSLPDSSTARGDTVSLLQDYCYVVVQDGLIRRTEWDHHRNGSSVHRNMVDRWIDSPNPGSPFPRRHSAPLFDGESFRGAGTAVPVFSLRTCDDFGIGDFRDLRPLVDWAASTGQCIIQLLPINDTTRKGGWEDSYPYSPVSTFALHPLYIRLQDVGVCEDESFRQIQSELNSLEEIDYPRVFREKMALLHGAFEKSGKDDLSGASFRSFYDRNAYWLEEYAQFCAQRDGCQAEFYYWVQFHLDLQLSEEVAYARSRGVYFKGDLPIGVSADSAEAHWHPELFNPDSSAGAPPDFFSEDGQNWGFPTYNWDEMAKDDYAWWKARLRKMSEYFDAFRIDHILGFFRIWEIPAGEHSGKEGHFNPALPFSASEIGDAGLPLQGLFHEDPHHPGMFQPYISPDSGKLDAWQKERFDAMYYDFFYHRHNDFWKRNAEKKLPELLSATGMLACGEDLGMVPDCVPEVMDHEKILSLRIRGFDSPGPWLTTSVCATSSHDMPTLRMQLASEDSEPSCATCREKLLELLRSPSMLAIFPLQDWLSISEGLRRTDYMSERINHPEIPHHHWRFRLHIDLRQLLGGTSGDGNGDPGNSFTAEVTDLISITGRKNQTSGADSNSLRKRRSFSK